MEANESNMKPKTKCPVHTHLRSSEGERDELNVHAVIDDLKSRARLSFDEAKLHTNPDVIDVLKGAGVGYLEWALSLQRILLLAGIPVGDLIVPREP